MFRDVIIKFLISFRTEAGGLNFEQKEMKLSKSSKTILAIFQLLVQSVINKLQEIEKIISIFIKDPSSYKEMTSVYYDKNAKSDDVQTCY